MDRDASITFGSPAAMMVKVPVLAPVVPPLTGESMKPQPRSAQRWPSAAASVGDMVTHDITVIPSAAVSTTPPGPNSTCSACLPLTTKRTACVAPCAAKCPAGLDIPGFVYQIASGDNVR